MSQKFFKITLRQIIILIALIIGFLNLFLVPVLLPEKPGTTIFTITIFAIIIILLFTIATSRAPTLQPPITDDYYQLSYTVSYKRKLFPLVTTLLTLASLIWLFISKINKSGAEIASAFFVGFGFLAVTEFILNWYKATKYNDITFLLSRDGFEKRLGEWKESYNWSDYECFTTVYQARFGNFLTLLPYSSLFLSDTDQYTINLYRRSGNLYDQIRTLPENHEKVVEYIKQYLPYKRKDIL